jgi:nitrite reductase/ring-hydroxylating ferredoxin subunit
MATKSVVSTTPARFVRAAQLDELRATNCLPVQVEGHTLALFLHDNKPCAVDNRCPHMGFPLHRGTVKDGVLTCHWHHARFDLASGGTFDQWADDVRSYPVEIRGDEIWVDLTPRIDAIAHQQQRLLDGLERNIPLVIAKAVITLLDSDVDPVEPFRAGLEFGTRYRQAGWGSGLTIHTCMMNLIPHLHPDDSMRALYHGLSAVAQDSATMAPRFGVHALPGSTSDLATLKRWFRQFVEVRDAEGAERCIVSAVRAGADHRQMASMLFAAATDHRYIETGHVLDFTNKALEALDLSGWQLASPVLTSLANSYASAERMEESNSWRNPVDLIAILERAFEELPSAIEKGGSQRKTSAGQDTLLTTLLGVVLGEDPSAIAEALLGALREGCTAVDLAGVVTHAAALRIAQFHTTNEFPDWDTALHTFTFANAVQQGLRRTESPELLRGVFDAAMSVYLDRFLNVPAAPLAESDGTVKDTEAPLQELPTLLDRQQRVNEAGALVARYLHGGGDPDRLTATLGNLLLREDRNFHTIQVVEAATRQFTLFPGTPSGIHAMIAAARYLAAHSPTVRAQGQTYQIAHRLSRGEHLFEE